MSYRLKLKEPLAKGLRRVALDQIEIVEGKLRAEENVAGAVHDARRCLKRLRALLRLIRPMLDDKIYRKEALRLAEVGRMLAGERDRFVMLQTLKMFESQYGSLPDEAGARITALITEGHDLNAAPEAKSRRQALSKLAISRKFFSSSALHDVRMTDVLEGLEKVYSKARRALKTCYRKPSDEAFHAWRKSVQQHWRHVALLSRAWPDALLARSTEAKELSQLLGEDHDIFVLMTFVRQNRGSLPESAVEALEAQARETQDRLRQLAKLHGERLLFERPEELTARITVYWEAARHLAEATAATPPKGDAASTLSVDAAAAARALDDDDAPVAIVALQRRSPRRKATA